MSQLPDIGAQGWIAAKVTVFDDGVEAMELDTGSIRSMNRERNNLQFGRRSVRFRLKGPASRND